MTVSEAKAFFVSMGCSGFHMCREDTDKYYQYQALHIGGEIEQQWTEEAFMDTYDKILNGQYVKPLWQGYSVCVDYMHTVKSKDFFGKMLILTRFVAANEVDGNRVIVAETINGRRDNNFRDGLIYGAYDCGMVDEAIEFVKIALWLAENDKEPVPVKHYWSMERVNKSIQKTDAICMDLKLLLQR